MGHWNHRVVRRVYPDGEVHFQIHEAFYGIDGEDKVSITNDPTGIVADSLDGLKEVVQWVSGCLDKPVLDWETREPIHICSNCGIEISETSKYCSLCSLEDPQLKFEFPEN